MVIGLCDNIGTVGWVWIQRLCVQPSGVQRSTFLVSITLLCPGKLLRCVHSFSLRYHLVKSMERRRRSLTGTAECLRCRYSVGGCSLLDHYRSSPASLEKLVQPEPDCANSYAHLVI